MTIRKINNISQMGAGTPANTGSAAPSLGKHFRKLRKAEKAKAVLQRQPRGRMDPFTRDQLLLIRAALKAKGHTRDLALLNLGVDSMLRGGDLLALRVRDVVDAQGEFRASLVLRQEKTSRPVQINLTPKTHEALAALILEEDKRPDDFLFTATGCPHGPRLSTAMLRLLVKSWARLCHADPVRYSNHSLRRTKAAILYAETRDVESIRVLLGHTSLSQTIAYLGVTEADAGAIARNFDV